MATQIKISELPLANESALSLAADDRFIFNNDNVNTQTIKFANFVDAICEQNLTFTGNCSFTQPIVGPDGGDIQVGLDDLVDVQFQNVLSGQILQYSGTQWINKDVASIAIQLDSLSVVTADTPMDGGSLEYDSANGEFTFTPAVVNTFARTDLSVTVPQAASGQGNLVYDNVNGVFTFTKADAYLKSETYSQSEVDTALANKADTFSVYLKTETYSQTEVNTLLGAKADANNVYTIAQVDAALDLKADLATTYTQTQVDANFALKTEVISLANLSTATGAATGGGTLAYDNTSGVFTFSPADSYTKAEADAAFAPIGTAGIALTDLSVNTGAANGGGTLLYDNTTGVFSFTPADAYTVDQVDTALTAKADLAGATFTGTITGAQTGNIIPFYFADQGSFGDASIFHGAVAHSHSDGAMYFAHGGAWNKLANDADYISIADLQTLVAGAADYAAFRAAIAAL